MTMTATEFREVADLIRKQTGVWGLAVVGASNLGFAKGHGYGALSFQARLHFKDQTRPRRMRVTVSLTAMDLYEVSVTKPDFTEVVFADNVYAEDLQETMYRLDSEGVPK
jgi:hypothetical protein